MSKELIQLRRDWVMTAFILTLPVLQLMLLARATTSSIADLSVAALDHDRTALSRRLLESLENRNELEVRYAPGTLRQARHLLDTGDATLVVVIPHGFSAALSRPSEAAAVQLIADASNDLMADIALGAAREVLAGLSHDGPPSRAPDQASPIELRTTVRYNPTLDIKLFTVPAQVGFIVYQVTLAVASIGLARERELGTLEQLIVMPMTRIELVVGKAIPALIVGMLNYALMLSVAILVFRIPVRGSIPLLLALTLVFVLVEIGYGLLISSIARTQQQAILLVFVLAMMDMAFSGYLVPIKNLPGAFRMLARAIPLRHYLTVSRSMMLKGAGLNVLWDHAAAMVVIGIFVTGLAVRNLNRTLD